jgi:hypothetical protein
MFKRFSLLILILNLSVICFGQQGRTGKTPQKGKSQPLVEMEIRNQMLLQLPDKISSMDEPALRAFLRLRLLTDLWNSPQAGNFRELAEQLAVEGVADIQENKELFPERLRSSLPKDFMAQIQLHAPGIAARLTEKYNLERNNEEQDQFDKASALLSAKNGEATAIETLQRGLASGHDPGIKLSFFIDQLQQKQPNEVPQILAQVLTLEEQRPGTFSLNTLYWLNGFYLAEKSPLSLKRRFLATILNITKDSYSWSDESQIEQAYNLLSDLLPVINRLTPSLQEQASLQLLVLKPKMKSQLRIREIAERAKQAPDPLDVWRSEAEDPDNKDIRNELLTVAAHIALNKQRLDLAIELITTLENKGQNEQLTLWHDQFLGDIVEAALKAKAPEIAEKAASKIKAPLKRTSAMQRIALHLFENGDSMNAQELLDDAAKVIASTEDNAAKAIAYLSLSNAYTKVNDLKVTETILAAIKVANNLPQPLPQDKHGSAVRDRFINDLSFIAWNLIPVFQGLAQKNQSEALLLSSKIQRRELKTTAEFGIYVGLGQTQRQSKESANTN